MSRLRDEGLNLRHLERTVREAAVAVCARHEIHGTDLEIEAAVLADPALLDEVKRYVASAPTTAARYLQSPLGALR